jgi:hypothetical protein
MMGWCCSKRTRFFREGSERCYSATYVEISQISLKNIFVARFNTLYKSFQCMKYCLIEREQFPLKSSLSKFDVYKRRYFINSFSTANLAKESPRSGYEKPWNGDDWYNFQNLFGCNETSNFTGLNIEVVVPVEKNKPNFVCTWLASSLCVFLFPLVIYCELGSNGGCVFNLNMYRIPSKSWYFKQRLFVKEEGFPLSYPDLATDCLGTLELNNDWVRNVE